MADENANVESGKEEGTQGIVEKPDEGNQEENAENKEVKTEEPDKSSEGEEKEGDLTSLKSENTTLTKRLGDKDSHISTLERENKDLRGSEKAPPQKYDLSVRFPKEAAEIAQLRFDGKDLEADELSAQVRGNIYEERIAKDSEARKLIVDESQNRNNYRDFDKYKKAVDEGLKRVPLDVLEKNPDYWVGKEYHAAVGSDYLSLKEKGKTTGKVDAGGGASSISGSQSGQEKNESEKIGDSIVNAYPRSGF